MEGDEIRTPSQVNQKTMNLVTEEGGKCYTFQKQKQKVELATLLSVFFKTWIFFLLTIFNT